MKRLLLPLISLSILGAGCTGEPAPAPQPEPTKPVVTAPTTEPAPTPVPSEPTTQPSDEPGDETTSLAPATTDATWQTYTSAALSFSFMTPTKGRYAPEWEVKAFAETDAAVAGGCYGVSGGEVTDPKHVTVGSQAFCHTSASEGAAGSVYFTDAYATKIGSRIAVIVFTKKVTNGGMIPNCSETYSSVSTACVPFSLTEYQAALDGIVGTFQLTK